MTLFFKACGPSSLCCQDGLALPPPGPGALPQQAQTMHGGGSSMTAVERELLQGGGQASVDTRAGGLGPGGPGGGRGAETGPASGEYGQAPFRQTLQVPVSFSRFLAGGALAAKGGYPDGAEQQQVLEQQKLELQEILKHFTRELIRGVSVAVVLDDGTSVECMMKLDPALTQFSMRVAETYRNVPLATIQQVCSPEETRLLQTPNQHYLDVRCATLVLQDGQNSQFVTFRFDTVPVREYFCTCLRVLRMAREEAGF